MSEPVYGRVSRCFSRVCPDSGGWNHGADAKLPVELELETVRERLLGLTEVERHIGLRSSRREARRCAWAYIQGLLSPVERKNSMRHGS